MSHLVLDPVVVNHSAAEQRRQKKNKCIKLNFNPTRIVSIGAVNHIYFPNAQIAITAYILMYIVCCYVLSYMFTWKLETWIMTCQMFYYVGNVLNVCVRNPVYDWICFVMIKTPESTFKLFFFFIKELSWLEKWLCRSYVQYNKLSW